MQASLGKMKRVCKFHGNILSNICKLYNRKPFQDNEQGTFIQNSLFALHYAEQRHRRNILQRFAMNDGAFLVLLGKNQAESQALETLQRMSENDFVNSFHVKKECSLLMVPFSRKFTKTAPPSSKKHLRSLYHFSDFFTF